MWHRADRPAGETRSGTRLGLGGVGRACLIGLGGWAALVLAARFVGLRVIHRQPEAALFFPPLAVRYDPRWNARAIIPILLAVLFLAISPRLAHSLAWRPLLLGAFLVGLAWALGLAQVDGRSGLTGDTNYLDVVPLVHGPATFLSSFVARIGSYTQHVRAHPPGMVLLLWALARIGLGGSLTEGLLVTTAGCAAIPAVLIAAREVAGEDRARAAAPFLALAPLAIWIATSADALYAGVGAWAVALIVLATGQSGRRSATLAISGGLLFGAGLFLTYGLMPLALVPVAVAVSRRRLRPLLLAATGPALVAVGFALAGFWWLDGLRATLVQYSSGVARFRPQSAFWLVNLGAFAIALGPAVGPLLAGRRHRASWLLVGGALAAVALSDASALSRAEVERIWLPFAPWILLAATSLTPEDARGYEGLPQHATRQLLALQLVAALALQLTVQGP